MANSVARTQFATNRHQKVIIAFRLGFDQVDGQRGFGRAQGPDMQMMKIGNSW